MILSIQNLSKKYRKEKFGLKDYSITIENGILGLLGPNGAGKSTLMKIIATIRPAPTLSAEDFLKQDFLQFVYRYNIKFWKLYLLQNIEMPVMCNKIIGIGGNCTIYKLIVVFIRQ